MGKYLSLITALCLSAFTLSANAADPSAPAVTATTSVKPKSAALPGLKPNKPVLITVTCVITNNTAQTQVISRYCTLQAAITGDDSRQIPLAEAGADASRRIDPADILAIAPGKQVTVTFELGFFSTDKGILLQHIDESGEYWIGSWTRASKFIDIGLVYANPPTREQIEKMRPELKGTQYELPEIKIPSVRVEIAG